MNVLLIDYFTKEQLEDTTLEQVQKKAGINNLTLKVLNKREDLWVVALIKPSDLYKQDKLNREKLRLSEVVRKTIKFKASIQDKDAERKITQLLKYTEGRFEFRIMFHKKILTSIKEKIIDIIKNILPEKYFKYQNEKGQETNQNLIIQHKK